MAFEYTRKWAATAEIDYVVLANRGRLRYLKAGTGPALLLLHTLRTQLDYFQRLIPRLTNHFTVYAVDLPGLGWSDIRPDASYDEPTIRAAIMEFIRRLDLRDLRLAGESIGATLSLSIAAELGAQAKHVIALNTYDYPQGVERANLLASVVIRAMRVPGIGLVPAKLENALILGAILRGGFANPRTLPRDFVAELIKSGHRPGFGRVATAYLRSLETFIAARRLYGRIKAPVALVYGEKDWSTAMERQNVANRITGSRMLTLADTGHFASLEHPEKVARILIDEVAGT